MVGEDTATLLVPRELLIDLIQTWIKGPKEPKLKTGSCFKNLMFVSGSTDQKSKRY